MTEVHGIDFFPRERQRSSTNPYRNWPDERRFEFLNPLFGIRAYYRLVPIGGAGDVKAFRAMPDKQQQPLTGTQQAAFRVFLPRIPRETPIMRDLKRLRWSRR